MLKVDSTIIFYKLSFVSTNICTNRFSISKEIFHQYRIRPFTDSEVVKFHGQLLSEISSDRVIVDQNMHITASKNL
jgi:hypothetical protein